MRNLLLSIGLAASLTVQGAESERIKAYVCIPDYSTGYSVGPSGRWEPTQFNVAGKKYLLRYLAGQWFWSDFGEEFIDPDNKCENFNDRGFTECKASEVKVLFNRKTLRFQAVHPYGYVASDLATDKKPITPYYEIGTCSPL